MRQEPGARQFASGKEALSRVSFAEIDGNNLSISSETDDVTLNAAEAARLADFLRDQSCYPTVAERLTKIHEYVVTSEISKQALYPLLGVEVASLLYTAK